jgi:two-component system, cell cycle sensor histidine kinase and response regulator CckA
MMESCERKIVIVEDEGLIAADLQGRLERAGYQVPGVAASGGEALQVIRAEAPDLVLMDIRLAGELDGIQVADKVRNEFDIPVVYLTAYEDRATLQRASQTQAFGYIKKPITSASLQGSIEVAISKHRHERYLREQRDWLSASFSAVPNAVVVTDGSGRICYLNRAAEELTGCIVDNALGRPSAELLTFTYPDGQPVEDLVPVAMLQGTPVRLPAGIWLQGAGHTRRAIGGTAAPRLHEGHIQGVVVVFQDVTLREFEEEQSRQEKKHQALSRLADGISGQLQLELSAVAEESTRILQSLPSACLILSSVQTIESAAKEAFAVTSRLRAFAQEKEIEPRPVQVNEILKRLAAVWKEALPGFTLELDGDPRPVQADSHELTRALDLIFQHAHHWMDAGCGIAISASGAEPEGLENWLRIRIAYTSTGEDAAAIERAFDPSWDGNWEGLPFVYGLIKRMGGLISARMEGSGKVTFEVYLPSIKVMAAGVPLEHLGKPVMLLIDANAEARRVLHTHFEQHGYHVLEARNCDEALLLAESSEHTIRLVLANPAKEDQRSAELVGTLVHNQAGTYLRLFDGYREKGHASESRCLTKWDLLEWANDLLGSATWVLAAN